VNNSSRTYWIILPQCRRRETSIDIGLLRRFIIQFPMDYRPRRRWEIF
jgi:hypothetical protein